MSEVRKDKYVLFAEKEVKKDEIIAASSRLVKDHDDTDNSGMTEVSYRLLMELNQRLHEMGEIELQIEDWRIYPNGR